MATTYHCAVLTSWVESGDVRRMRVEMEHPVGEWSDITGQPESTLPCDPNALVVEGRHIPEDDMAAIQADSNAVVLLCEVE